MTLLQDITTADLLGTERQAFTPPPSPGPLGEMLARLSADPEAGLLGAAALASLHQRAGTLPSVTALDRPTPCPPDDQPVCSERVAQGLAVMLGGTHKGALPEMLTAQAATGRRVPEPLLPELLKLGRQDRSLRDFLLPVLGRRGRWLGAQNREWSYADQLVLETAESPEQVWAEGGREARLATLTRLRETDPAAGLALLQTTWATETADDRASFLTALETGLSLADEPFLEAALDDRGKDVRRTAAGLLARLPASGLVRRMIARAEPLLAWKQPLLRAGEIEVTLPEACDAALIRDGVDPKQRSGTGEKAGWLLQILRVIPPTHWSQKWGRKPAQILAAKGEWHGLFLEAWLGAVQLHPDADWQEALIRAAMAQDAEQNTQWLSRLGPTLGQTIPTRLETLAMEALAGGLLADRSVALTLLQSHTRPWSAALSRAFVDSLRRGIGQAGDVRQNQSVWYVSSLLRGPAALYVPPILADEFTQGWPEQSPQWAYWQPHVTEFLATLHFRHDLLNAISQDSSQETRP